jgi:hypothetical protein
MPRSDPRISAVLGEIFCAQTGYSSRDADVLATTPSFSVIRRLAALLAASPAEEALQVFIKTNPALLMGLYGWGDDSILAFLTKSNIGTRYRCDFCVLQYGQGGCSIHLVEIEPSKERLFTRAGARARRHNAAWTQVRMWTEWANANKDSFIRELLETVRQLPEFPKRAPNGSFRRRSYAELETLWRGFGGFDAPTIDGTIVIGRWSRMTTAERRHLLTQNQYDNKLARVITYDQLARSAYERPLRIY